MTGRHHRIGGALLSTAFVLATAMCSRAGEQFTPETGIEVQVLKGPIEPVVHEDDHDPNVAPVPGAVVVVEPFAGGRSRQVPTDSAGMARFHVPPAQYRVSVKQCPGAIALPREADSVSVVVDSFSSTQLICDTGIR